MKKKLIAPDLPDNPTEEQKEAFRLEVTQSMNHIMDFTPQERNEFLSNVLLQLIANGMRPIEGALPEGITVSPIIPGGFIAPGRFLRRKINIKEVK